MGFRKEEEPTRKPKGGEKKICKGPLKHVRANKVHNEIKTGKITPRAREPCEMCRNEMRSSLGVVKLDILHLRLSRGLDARGCRLLRRRSVMPWWRRGSYATIKSLVI